MQNALAIYQFDANPVRVVKIDDAPWFIASDVASVLGYRDAANMVRNLDEDEKGTHNMSTLGGDQTLTIISESGLYAAILRSRRPEAKRFRKWVTAEVLPSIRRTGFYIAPGQDQARVLSVALQAVREARRMYGRAGAHTVWQALGLPNAGVDPIPDAEPDPWREQLADWLASQEAVTISDAIAALALPAEADVSTRRRLGRLLRQLGWHAVAARQGEDVVKLFTRLEAEG